MSRAHSKTSPAGRRAHRGFTLIELMVVVAIIGVLVAIAIPNFLRFQLRAKATEGKMNLASLAKSEEAYYATYGTYVGVGAPAPVAFPTGGRTPWVLGTGFDVLGWAPEGEVYFVYLASADDAGLGGALVRYTAEAASDIDGDGAINYWGYLKPAVGATTGIAGVIAGSTCPATGTYDTVSMVNDVLMTVGPCDPNAGTSTF